MKEKNKKTNQEIIEGYDYLGNSCSSMDCTGLIPRAPLNEAERESYEEVYHYQPKAAPKQ
ncbi:MAG: hypothetical protein HFI29_12875 [Lachnospiraceae bacterium]|jgi:hypothetical protein|nr:hypothetical protein [Lachnospiraceae bacterium]